MTIKPDKPLQVGAWQYLPEQDKLVQFAADGTIAVTAELDNLSQKVLNYFIVNAGRLITKDELLADVWGIRDVSDGRVTRVIRVLRVALGDDTREPSYIETIPKRGYRFVATVSEIQPQAGQQQPEQQQTELNDTTKQQKQQKLTWLLAATAAAIIVIVSLFFLSSGKQREAELDIPLLRYTPITAMDGLEFYHNVSEDERYLLYSYASPDNENVTVLILEDLVEHKRFQFTEDSYSSFGASFSPDGDQIAYHRYYPDGKCSIRLARFDKVKFEVKDDKELTPCSDLSPSSRVTWSPDAKYVIYPTMSSRRQMVLMMKPLQGGPAEQLTTPPPSSFGDYAARFSFKGDKLVFIRGAGNHAQLWLLDLGNRELTLLVNVTGSLPGNVGWSADDKSVIYPSAPTVISKVDIASGVSTVIAHTDLGTEEIQTLRNGQFFATVGNFAHTNITQVSNPLTSGDQLSDVVFSSNRNESHAEANPIEGGPVAVVSRRSGLPQVWLFYPDGNQRQLTFFEKNERIRSLAFAPNGRDLLVQLNNELWILSHNGTLTPVPHNAEITVTTPVWGRSGEHVYYAESINGRWQIARYNVSTQQIDPKPYAYDQEMYIESFDGKHVFWRDAATKKFYVKDIDSNVIDELPISFPDYQLWFKFNLKPSGIYFAYLLEDIYYSLKFYSFETKEIVDILPDKTLTHSRFSVSANEKSFFILESIRGDLDVAKLVFP